MTQTTKALYIVMFCHFRLEFSIMQDSQLKSGEANAVFAMETSEQILTMANYHQIIPLWYEISGKVKPCID